MSYYAVAPRHGFAILARAMLPPDRQPGVVTNYAWHGHHLAWRDPGYVCHSSRIKTFRCRDGRVRFSETGDAASAASGHGPMEVIHNFFAPRPPQRSRAAVREELGLRDEVMLFHSSNLRPVKRIDLLLETVARIRPRDSFKLVILAGGNFNHSLPMSAVWNWKHW